MPQVFSGLKHSVEKDDYPFFMYEPRKGTPSPSACVNIASDESCAFKSEAQHSHRLSFTIDSNKIGKG